VLLNLYAVLTIPETSSDSAPLTFFHASFRDFFVDPNRSGKDKYFLDPSESHRLLSEGCLQVMAQALIKDDICSLGDKDTPLSSISSSTVDQHIPSLLQYACMNCLPHFLELDSNQLSNLESTILEFFQQRALRWIECLALLQNLDSALTFLRTFEVSQKVLLSDSRKLIYLMTD
jgi:hypothetical protein